MQAQLLKIEKLDVGYKTGRDYKVVVGTIDATLRAGELVALIGHNGAGKSTLLNTLSALQRPLSGKVLYADGDVTELSQKELSHCVSVVLTNNAFSNLTVRELVALGRTPHTGFLGSMTQHDRAVVDKAMELMAVSHLASRQVNELSDGERQKCMIAKAIAQETPLMLLDEPTAFLDFGSKVHLFRTMRSLARESQKALLVSTHDIELALRFADRLWLVNNGNLYEGTTDELAEKGIIQAFVGEDNVVYDKKNGRIEITQI